MKLVKLTIEVTAPTREKALEVGYHVLNGLRDLPCSPYVGSVQSANAAGIATVSWTEGKPAETQMEFVNQRIEQFYT